MSQVILKTEMNVVNEVVQDLPRLENQILKAADVSCFQRRRPTRVASEVRYPTMYSIEQIKLTLTYAPQSRNV